MCLSPHSSTSLAQLSSCGGLLQLWRARATCPCSLQSARASQEVCSTMPISYSALGPHFLVIMRELGFPAECMGLHLLRSRGTTMAVNQGVEERLLLEHGGFASTSSLHRYIKTSLIWRLYPWMGIGCVCQKTCPIFRCLRMPFWVVTSMERQFYVCPRKSNGLGR